MDLTMIWAFVINVILKNLGKLKAVLGERINIIIIKKILARFGESVLKVGE